MGEFLLAKSLRSACRRSLPIRFRPPQWARGRRNEWLELAQTTIGNNQQQSLWFWQRVWLPSHSLPAESLLIWPLRAGARHVMKTTLLAAAFVAFTGSVFAADMPVKAPPAPPAPPAPSWTGWYIGINGGGAWGSVDPGAVDAGPDSFFAAANVGAVRAGAGEHFDMHGGL